MARSTGFEDRLGLDTGSISSYGVRWLPHASELSIVLSFHFLTGKEDLLKKKKVGTPPQRVWVRIHWDNPGARLEIY